MKKEKFVIIDGNALIHRAFHALPPFSTQDGRVVNAVYGFTNILLKMLKEISPDYLIVCFDRKEKTFRHEAFEGYKAQRKKQPDELYDQIPLIYDVLDAFNISYIDKAGYEADDLIGTLAQKNIEHKHIQTIVVTGDLDTLQLVDDENTIVYTFKKGISDIVIYDEEAVKERYGGLKPDQLIDYKALRGDPSDNIPGVPGVGEKTAISLISEFKTLENLYKHIDSEKIKDRYRKLLIKHEKDAQDSKKLVTILRDVEFDYDLDSCKLGDFKREEVISLFQDLEFKSLLTKIPNPKIPSAQTDIFSAPKPTQEPKIKKEEGVTYTLINEEKSFEDFLKTLKKQKRFAFDTETTSLDFTQAELLGISFCFNEKEAYYVVMKGTNFLESLTPIFHDEKVKKIAHNAKYDLLIMKNEKVEVKGLDFDSMIASYLTSSGTRSHGLDHLAFVEFGHEMIAYEDLVGKGKNQISLEEVPIEDVSWYACEDADYTFRLYNVFNERLEEQELTKLFQEIEMPLVEVLVDMEYTGVLLDTDFLKSLSKKHAKTIKKIEETIYEMSGVKFNIKSPAQLKEVLFDQMGLSAEGLKKTKTGISTAAPELEKIRNDHEIIDQIMQYRELTKLKSTYIDALPKLVSKKTGHIHTSFNQTIAATGRLSSSDPNLQNIPIKTDIGKEIREAFIARDGFQIVDLDYSQIELRIMASLSQDERMIKAFKEGVDIHTSTAAQINKVEMDEVTSQMRREAKAVNFGILYGMGHVGLSRATGLSSLRAKEFIKRYFELYPGVYEYIIHTKQEAYDLGYAQTMFGRKRYLPDLYSGMPQMRAAAERMAVNMPVQGTNADIIKMAMVKLHDELPEVNDKTRMILQVHDDLVFEIPEKSLKKVVAYIKETMETIVTLDVPLIVDAKGGDNWGVLKQL